MSLEKEIRNLFIKNTLNGLKTPLYYFVWILGGLMLGFLLTACGGEAAPLDGSSLASTSDYRDYCQVVLQKNEICSQSQYANRTAEIQNCASILSHCSYTKDQISSIQSEIVSQSCGEYAQMLEDNLNNGDYGQGCGAL